MNQRDWQYGIPGTGSERVGPGLDLNPELLIPNTASSSLPLPAPMIPEDSPIP